MRSKHIGHLAYLYDNGGHYIVGATCSLCEKYYHNPRSTTAVISFVVQHLSCDREKQHHQEEGKTRDTKRKKAHARTRSSEKRKRHQ